uniref:PIF1/LRR1 pleckstrin homology domain-containing protein n=1 Tax=Branchiostoma floridae TaxID=7739 RepID=C3XZL0_BRAFL|eukprot:XP_002610521.1 hypothetical protein BRAFLDRAFT_260421 [Branchiostoma floridae]
MRLICTVEVNNRLCPSHNLASSKSKGRGGHATLTLGRKPGSDSKEGMVFLMMCTAKDKTGTKYKLKGNVGQIFGRFVQEGKATIRFHQPEHDICISKADPINLKALLSAVKLAHHGQEMSRAQVSTLTPARASQVEPPKTKMTVSKRKDYPLTKSFPSSLLELRINHCTLNRVDTRILGLKHLKLLDMSDNNIRILPETIGELKCLADLNMSNNQLTELPGKFFQSTLRNSLQSVDLSHNQLSRLPNQLCACVDLVSLKLDSNQLSGLPPSIGLLRKLRFLTATRNHITLLPASFLKLQLETVDLFENPFLEDGPSTLMGNLTFPSLLEITARVVKKHRLHYTEEDLPRTLISYLDVAKRCLCGQLCFENFVRFLARLDLHRLAHTVTAVDSQGRTHAPLEAFLCSETCSAKYRKHPAGFWK